VSYPRISLVGLMRGRVEVGLSSPRISFVRLILEYLFLTSLHNPKFISIFWH
jgi:hypothetical protein